MRKTMKICRKMYLAKRKFNFHGPVKFAEGPGFSDDFHEVKMFHCIKKCEVIITVVMGDKLSLDFGAKVQPLLRIPNATA